MNAKIIFLCLLTVAPNTLFAESVYLARAPAYIDEVIDIFSGDTTRARKELQKRKNEHDIRKRSGENRFRDHDGRVVINSKYAGKEFPLKEFSPDLEKKYRYPIRFNKYGYPDFSNYVRQTVSSDRLSGKQSDFAIANEIMRKRIPSWEQPRDMTWHHHQDGRTLQLIPRDLHEAVRHSGGASRLKAGDN